MLSVVSPAKALDFETAVATAKESEPRMLDRSAELAAIMAGKSEDEVRSLMGLSAKLGALNADRFQAWRRDHSNGESRQAVLAFDGDTYHGLDAPASFSERDYTHAQKTLRILSGLYGVLRPLDTIQPYRLEMGTKLATPKGDDLYAFWGSEITTTLQSDLDASPGAAVIVNLASKEYFSAVKQDQLAARVITPKFLDSKGGAPPKVVSFFAKRARGAMAGWMVRERITTARAIAEFDGLGYRHDPDASGGDAPTFVRYA